MQTGILRLRRAALLLIKGEHAQLYALARIVKSAVRLIRRVKAVGMQRLRSRLQVIQQRLRSGIHTKT